MKHPVIVLISASWISYLAFGCGAAMTEESRTAAKVDSSPDAALCPSAPEDRGLSLFWWRTRREVIMPVWSSDGSMVAAFEQSYEEKKSWDPLSGTTEKRKFCHRLVVQKPDGSERRYVGPVRAGQAIVPFYYKPSDRIYIGAYKDQTREFYRVEADGSRRLIATLAAGDELLPSPDGNVLARITLPIPYCDVKGPEDPLPLVTNKVQMLNAEGQAIGLQKDVTQRCFSLGFTWTPAQTFIVFDGESAQAFDAEGTDLGTVSQPGCAAPRTSTSEVDGQGRVLGYDDKGQVGVVSSDGQAFGCQ
jgi:hypothetical protein